MVAPKVEQPSQHFSQAKLNIGTQSDRVSGDSLKEIEREEFKKSGPSEID